MNLSGTLQALLRRWYIVVAGLVLAGIAGYSAWTHITPQYERSASQVLMPGAGSLPSDKANPYLYLGGLLQAADVVVRVAGSNDVVAELLKQHPGAQVTVVRDPTSSGPVILTTVSASSDAVAKEVLDKVVAQTAAELDRLQTSENIDVKDRISVSTLTVDQKPTLQQRKRLVATGGAAGGVLALSLVVASVVDGLLRRRTRKRSAKADRHSNASRVKLDQDATRDKDPAEEIVNEANSTRESEVGSASAEPRPGPPSARVLESVSSGH